MLRHRITVDRQQPARPCASRRTRGRASTRARDSSRPAAGRGEQPAQRPRPVVRVVPVDQHAADPVADRGDQTADRGGHDRRAAGLRLERDQTERLVVRRHGDQVGGAVERRRGRRRSAAAGTARASADAERRRPARSARSAGPGRCRSGPPTITTVRSRATARVEPLQRGGRGQEHVGRLERLDPADEGDDVAALRRPSRSRATGAELGRRGENRSRSTPGCDDGRRRSAAAPYRSIRSRASNGVLATSRSASATTCSSPITRASGSGRSPAASWAFLTLARVCAVCTSGTPQRSRASQPTWPESQ